MTDPRGAISRAGLFVALCLGALVTQPACVGTQGAPVNQDAARMMSQADNMAARGDLIGAEHMHHRVQVEAPGTLLGVLATLERHAVADRPEARAIRLFGGPSDDPWSSAGDGRFSGGGLDAPESEETDAPWRDGDVPSRGLQRCR